MPVAGRRSQGFGGRRILLACGFSAAGLAGACAPQGTTIELAAPRERAAEALPALAARLQLNRAPKSLAAVVAQDARGVTGLSLADRRPWQQEGSISQPPLLSGEIAVLGIGAELHAVRADTGQRLWSRPSGGAVLMAVADDGALAALALRDREGTRRWLEVVDRAGELRLRVLAPTELGVPALTHGLLITPVAPRWVSAIDVPSRAEVGRAALDTPAEQALWVDGELFLAGSTWVSAATPGRAYALPRRPLPGRVELGSGAVTPSIGPAVTRLYVRPPSGSEPPGPYLAAHGRMALGFDGARGALEWVSLLPGAVLGAAAFGEEFALCEAGGSLRWLAARDGRHLERHRLRRHGGRGEPGLQACAVAAGAGVRTARGSTRSSPGSAPPLIDQLARVLAVSDPELGDVQRFLSRELSVRPEPEATRVLIELASRRNADPILQAEAEDLLATRRNGVEFMLEALSRTGPRSADPIARAPIAALAEALAAVGDVRAAPLLAAQLNQPGHSPESVARVAAALEQLATESEYPALSVFFSIQRTTADQPERVQAVLSVARTLLRIGAASGGRLVQLAARDPLTAPEVRAGLEEALESLEGTPAPEPGPEVAP